MKFSYKAVAVATLPLVLAACGGDDNEYNEYKVNNHSAKTTLSGTIYDANTNDVVDAKKLKVKFFQGNDVRTAKYVKDEGYYSINKIPTNFNNTNEYRISVTAEGYLPFSGVVSFKHATPDYSEEVIDREFFNVGDITLFPIGTSAPDYKVTVRYNNQRVADATVVAKLTDTTSFIGSGQAKQITALGNGANFNGQDRIGIITATTDENGVATFSGENLVLGGQYRLSVEPTEVDGVNLYIQNDDVFTVGTSEVERKVELDKLTIGTDEGLYVVKASNEYGDALPAGNGNLIIEFSRAVEIVDQPTAALTGINLENGGQLKAELNVDTAPGVTPKTQSATASLSADGKTLTLAPNFKEALDKDDKNVEVHYAAVTVNIKGINKVVPVFGGLVTSSGIVLSNTVRINLP